MSVTDDIKRACAIDRQRGIMREGVQALIVPARSAVGDVMDAPVIADG